MHKRRLLHRRAPPDEPTTSRDHRQAIEEDATSSRRPRRTSASTSPTRTRLTSVSASSIPTAPSPATTSIASRQIVSVNGSPSAVATVAANAAKPSVLGLNMPVFIAIIAGAAALLLAVIVAVVCSCRRNRKRRQAQEDLYASHASNKRLATTPNEKADSIDKPSYRHSRQGSPLNEHAPAYDAYRQPSRFLPRSLSKRAFQDGPQHATVVPFDVRALGTPVSSDFTQPPTPNSAAPLIPFHQEIHTSIDTERLPVVSQLPFSAEHPSHEMPAPHLLNQHYTESDLGNSTSTGNSGPPAYARSSMYDETADVIAFDPSMEGYAAGHHETGQDRQAPVGLATAGSMAAQTYVPSRQPIQSTLQRQNHDMQLSTDQDELQTASLQASLPKPIVFTDPPKRAHAPGSYFPPIPSSASSTFAPSESAESSQPASRTLGQTPLLYSQVTDARMSIHSEMAELAGPSPSASPVKPMFGQTLSPEISPVKQRFNTSMAISVNNPFAQVPHEDEGDSSETRVRQVTNNTTASEAEAPFAIGRHFIEAKGTPPVTPVLPDADALPTINVEPSSVDSSFVDGFRPLSQMNLGIDPNYRSATYSIYGMYT